jgi:hypothetical protein
MPTGLSKRSKFADLRYLVFANISMQLIHYMLEHGSVGCQTGSFWDAVVVLHGSGQ